MSTLWLCQLIEYHNQLHKKKKRKESQNKVKKEKGKKTSSVIQLKWGRKKKQIDNLLDNGIGLDQLTDFIVISNLEPTKLCKWRVYNEKNVKHAHLSFSNTQRAVSIQIN